MGVDLLDLTFRIEREFEIKIPKDELQKLFLNEDSESLSRKFRQDIQVRELVTFVEIAIVRQNGGPACNVFNRVKKHIAECLQVDESHIIPEAWMIRELGME